MLPAEEGEDGEEVCMAGAITMVEPLMVQRLRSQSKPGGDVRVGLIGLAAEG